MAAGTTKVEPFGLGPVGSLPCYLAYPDASKMISANTTVQKITLIDVIPDGATLAEGSLSFTVDIRQALQIVHPAWRTWWRFAGESRHRAP